MIVFECVFWKNSSIGNSYQGVRYALITVKCSDHGGEYGHSQSVYDRKK